MTNNILKCVAMTKNNTPCKSKHTNNSIFCGVHKKNNPKLVIINFNSNFNIKDDIDLELEIKRILTIQIQNNPIIHTFKFTKEDEYLDQNKKQQELLINNSKEQIIKDRDKIIKDKNKRETNINSITTCKVCYEEHLNETLIRCSNISPENKHASCSECTLGHINSLMSNGIGSNTCMFDKSDKCCGTYSNKDIEKVIMQKDNTLSNTIKLQKWNELIDISEILKMASICDDYIICPLCCKWGCIFEIPAGVIGNFYIPCGKCDERWCNVCKRKAHGNRSCYKLEFTKTEITTKKIEVIDHMLQEIITKTLTHCCTSCGCAYIKDEGCNLMICPNCDGLSCYICNMRLYIKNNTKYWHFSGHELSDSNAMCPLWNNEAGDGKEAQGNTEYNKKAIESEITKFVKANINNLDTSKLICNRLLKLFEKDKENIDIIKQIAKKIIETY
jgi:hypothetical protein